MSLQLDGGRPLWTDAAVEHFNNEQIAAVVPLEVASDDSDRIVATGIEVGRGGRRIMLRPWGDASRVQGSIRMIFHHHQALHLRQVFGAAR